MHYITAIGLLIFFFIFKWCLEVLEASNCNFGSRNGFYAPKLVRNDILQLIIGLLVKNIFCSKVRWWPSWIVCSFRPSATCILKYQLVDIHQSIFHLNAFKNEFHWETSGWNKWILAFYCDRWRPFWFLRSTKFRPLFSREDSSLFFEKTETIVKPQYCRRLVTKSWFWTLL